MTKTLYILLVFCVLCLYGRAYTGIVDSYAAANGFAMSKLYCEYTHGISEKAILISPDDGFGQSPAG